MLSHSQPIAVIFHIAVSFAFLQYTSSAKGHVTPCSSGVDFTTFL